MELKIFVILTFVISALSGWLTIPKIILISKKKKFSTSFPRASPIMETFPVWEESRSSRRFFFR